jgi:ribosome maturation factor RimP
VGVNERVAGIVGPLVAARQLSLYDLELRGGILAVVVDREGGVDLDTISDLTRDVSRALDADDPLPGRYTLEVSSPGLERRLRTPAHFRGAIGDTVTVRVDGPDGPQRVRGILAAADDDGCTVRDDDLVEHAIAYPDIERARTVFEWGPPPRPKPARQRPEKKRVTP